jgi:hypothetical protein
MIHRPNTSRLGQIAHYIIARTPSYMLGATKLNKMLWFIDCHSYQRWGHSMTGLTHYVRLENGPVPDGLTGTLSDLKMSGKIAEDPQMTAVGMRREFLSLEEPDLDGMTAGEIDLIHSVIEAIRPLSAQQASDRSHDSLWQEIPTGSSITVAAGSAIPEPVDDAAYRWAMAEAARYDA